MLYMRSITIMWWEDIEFQSELQNAVNRGDSYTLSTAIAEKCRAKQQKKEKYEAMEQSKRIGVNMQICY